jgi:hypothetical protein
MALKLRRGTEANRTDITPAVGELIYVTDTQKIYVGDGSTPGGNLVTGSGGGGAITGITDNSTGPVLVLGDTVISIDADLNITNQEINGDGDIAITGDITASGTGIITGNSFVGDLTGAVTGDVAGDVTGNVTGDVTGNVISNSANTLVNASTQALAASALDILDSTLTLTYAGGITEVQLEADTTRNRFNLFTVDDSGDLSSYSGYYGVMNFGKRDSLVNRSDATIRGSNADLRLAHDTVTTLIDDETKYFTIKEGNFGFGTYTPTAKLDVRGDASAAGQMTADSFVGSFATDDSTVIIDGVSGKLLLGNTDAGPIVVSNPQTGQVLKWNGSQWTNASDAGGGSGSGGLSSISVGADDSALRIVEAGEAFLILGGTGVTTSSDVEGNITINASFDGTFSSITGKPTTLGGYGITDAATSTQGALADTALQPGDIFDLKGSVYADDSSTLVDAVAGKIVGAIETTNPVISGTIDSSDSSGITIVPAVTMNSDLTVENDITVTNKLTADTIQVTTLITEGAGTPELESETELLLSAGTRVTVNSSPIKLCTYTTSERDALVAENGDLIYNSTLGKLQGYQAGSWVNLDGDN